MILRLYSWKNVKLYLYRSVCLSVCLWNQVRKQYSAGFCSRLMPWGSALAPFDDGLGTIRWNKPSFTQLLLTSALPQQHRSTLEHWPCKLNHKILEMESTFSWSGNIWGLRNGECSLYVRRTMVVQVRRQVTGAGVQKIIWKKNQSLSVCIYKASTSRSFSLLLLILRRLI